MINPMRAQPTRMMGLASGMDTDFIIQQTLRMHQFKIDNVTRNKKLIEWKQQTQNSIKDEITSLRQTFLSNLGSKSMMSRNVFNATKVTTTGANSSAVTISSTTGTPTGSIRIGQIASLAKGASMTSGGSVSNSGGGFNNNARLDSLSFVNGGSIRFSNHQATVRTAGGGTTSISQSDFTAATAGIGAADMKATHTINGVTFDIVKVGNELTVSSGGEEIGVYDFDTIMGGESFEIEGQTFALENIGNTTNPDFRLNGQRLSFFQEVTTGSGDDAITFRRAEGSETITNNGRAVEMIGETEISINGTTIKLYSNETLGNMIDKINKEAPDITLSYNRLTDKFSIEHKTIGSSLGQLDLRDLGGGNLFDLLSTGRSGSGTAGPVAEEGTRARAFINGEWIERDTNQFEYRGVIIRLNETTNAGEEDTVVSFTRDATPAINAIKDFINAYNTIISRLEGLLSERKGRNEVGYKPLTDEEKQGMTDKQIEEWETIARKGLLRNDQGIQNLVNNLRGSFFSEIEGMGINPTSIGLSTGSYFDGTGGQIMINEERLREALEKDPDMVADVFIKIDSSSGSAKGVGLLHKIDGLMRDFVNVNQSTSIKNLEDSLKRTNDQIQRMQERMYAEEDKLYRQFAAMESEMQKLNQQGCWFNAMLGQ